MKFESYPHDTQYCGMMIESCMCLITHRLVCKGHIFIFALIFFGNSFLSEFQPFHWTLGYLFSFNPHYFKLGAKISKLVYKYG